MSAQPDDFKDTTFDEAFPEFINAFVTHTKEAYNMPEAALKRLEFLLSYNCVGGKMYRGKLVVDATRKLANIKGLDFSKLSKQATVLGWCIEVLQACFLVADDIMDGSETRRGQPCWYRRPEVQMDAVNDSLILETLIYFLIKKFFKESPCYMQVVELFQQVSYETQLGQMLDLMSQPQGQKNPDVLNKFNIDVYRRIVHYKTSFYTFYLSLACGMILCGYNNDNQLAVARRLAIELGEKFQIQDDYLDCYGDPSVIGKIGTDIQDHKCSWLVVQALMRVNAEQKKLLEACYGKHDEASVAAVKQLYRDLNLTQVFDQQEEDSYNRIQKLIAENDAVVPGVIFTTILQKIHRRQK